MDRDPFQGLCTCVAIFWRKSLYLQVGTFFITQLNNFSRKVSLYQSGWTLRVSFNQHSQLLEAVRILFSIQSGGIFGDNCALFHSGPESFSVDVGQQIWRHRCQNQDGHFTGMLSMVLSDLVSDQRRGVVKVRAIMVTRSGYNR